MTDKHPDLLERIRLRLEESFVGIGANVAELLRGGGAGAARTLL